MQNPLFSVVIPAFNVAACIKETLDSVRVQTFKDYEIIVVNDGSVDDTLEVLQDYFKNYPELSCQIVDQENKKVAAARNNGIRVARGELVAFLDADDKWHKDKLLKVVQYLEKNQDVDLVCHNEYLIKNGIKIQELVCGPYVAYKDLLFKKNCLSTSATVVKRSKLFKTGLFSENLDFDSVEDYELWLRLSQICKIKYLSEALGEYHVHGEGISSNIEKHSANSLNVVECHFKQWPRKSIYYKYLLAKRKAKIMRGAGKNFLLQKRYRLAKTYLIKSILLDPFSLKAWLFYSGAFLKIRI